MAIDEVAQSGDPARDPATPRDARDSRWVWIGAAAGLVLVVLLALVGWAVRSGFQGLSVERVDGSFRDVVGDVLLLTVMSGLLAAAATEFLKRQSGLRGWFHRREVEAFLGPAGRLPFGPFPVAGADRAPQKGSRGASPPTPLTELPPVAPTFSAPVGQLTAQVAQYLAFLAAGVAERSLAGDDARTASEVLVGTTAFRDGTRMWPDWLVDWTDGRPAEPPRRGPGRDVPPEDLVVEALMGHAERRLDAFQLQATARWHALLRTASAVTAGGFVLCAGLAIHAEWVTLVVGFLLGLVVGGPVSWAARDLVRVLERKAA